MMVSTRTSSTASPVGHRKAPGLVAFAALALVAPLLLAGCTSDHDALMAQADKDAKYEIARDHSATVSCVEMALGAGISLEEPDLPAPVEACFDMSTYGMSDSALKAGELFLPQGSSLRLIERDPHDANARRIVVIDAAVVSLQKLYSDVTVSYGQCWSSTIDLRAGTLTTPEREQCSADLLWQISGRGDQLDDFLTDEPDDIAGG